MAREQLAAAFNEWMRRYIEAPDQFAREWQSVTEFQREANEGREPTYGESCARYLDQLLTETAPVDQVAPPAVA